MKLFMSRSTTKITGCNHTLSVAVKLRSQTHSSPPEVSLALGTSSLRHHYYSAESSRCQMFPKNAVLVPVAWLTS